VRVALYKTPMGYVVISGNHRVECILILIEAGDLPPDVQIECYLVESSPEKVDVLTRIANCEDIRAYLSEEEARIQAIEIAKKHHYSAAAISKMTGISSSTLLSELGGEEIRSLLMENGVATENLKNYLLYLMRGLKGQLELLCLLAKTANQHRWTVEQIKDEVNELSKPETMEKKRDDFMNRLFPPSSARGDAPAALSAPSRPKGLPQRLRDNMNRHLKALADQLAVHRTRNENQLDRQQDFEEIKKYAEIVVLVLKSLLREGPGK